MSDQGTTVESRSKSSRSKGPLICLRSLALPRDEGVYRNSQPPSPFECKKIECMIGRRFVYDRDNDVELIS